MNSPDLWPSKLGTGLNVMLVWRMLGMVHLRCAPMRGWRLRIRNALMAEYRPPHLGGGLVHVSPSSYFCDRTKIAQKDASIEPVSTAVQSFMSLITWTQSLVVLLANDFWHPPLNFGVQLRGQIEIMLKYRAFTVLICNHQLILGLCHGNSGVATTPAPPLERAVTQHLSKETLS